VFFFTPLQFLEKKGNVFYPLSYGENYTKVNSSIHSEHACINRLKTNIGRTKNVSLVVIRTNFFGQLINSKPCKHCIQKMIDFIPSKGYRITKVYYSDKNGNIVKTSLDKLYNEDEKHVCKYFSRHK